MRKLSKYEKETIINWNEGETIASIYTFNASLKRRTSHDFRSGWCRRTAKNGWQLQGSAQKSMAFRSYRQKKKSLKMRAIYEKISGLHPLF